MNVTFQQSELNNSYFVTIQQKIYFEPDTFSKSIRVFKTFVNIAGLECIALLQPAYQNCYASVLSDCFLSIAIMINSITYSFVGWKKHHNTDAQVGQSPAECPSLETLSN